MSFLKQASIGCLALILSCVSGYAQAPSTARPAARFHEIIHQVKQTVHEATGLVPIASGGGVHEKIEAVTVSFASPKDLSTEEARLLIIQTAGLFLDVINQEPDAKEILSRYPFLPEDIRVLIRLNDRPGQLRSYETLGDKLATVMLCRGIVFYDKYCPSQACTMTVQQETFEEAISLVPSSDVDNVVTLDAQSFIGDAYQGEDHAGQKDEEDAEWKNAIGDLFSEVQKQYGFFNPSAQ